MHVGDNIKIGKLGWSFGGDVPEKFVKHIQKSIPLYDNGHDLICYLSRYFCRSGSVCYELGVSTGQLIKKLAKANEDKLGIRWIGIDAEKEMIKKAKKYCRGVNNIEFLCGDVADIKYEKTDFVASYYCLQFVPVFHRREVVREIYNALNPGGAFFLFEKIKSEDARFQEVMTSFCHNYKRKHGFSQEEIMNKDKSLQGILNPLTSEGNRGMLKKAGFKNIKIIMNCLCFEGVLAVK